MTYPIMIVLTLLLRFLLSGFALAQNPRVTGLNCTQPSGWDWVRSRNLFVQTCFERLIA
jgi:hypothetical protein